LFVCLFRDLFLGEKDMEGLGNVVPLPWQLRDGNWSWYTDENTSVTLIPFISLHSKNSCPLMFKDICKVHREDKNGAERWWK
jgi:hypothetical protein